MQNDQLFLLGFTPKISSSESMLKSMCAGIDERDFEVISFVGRDLPCAFRKLSISCAEREKIRLQSL